MKKIINIKDNLDIEFIENILMNNTLINVIDNGKKIVLSDVRTGNNFYSDFTYNDYYIVSYSRGNVNERPLILHTCYSIKDGRVIDFADPLNEKLKNALENMLLTGKSFSLAHVLQELNLCDLELLVDEEKDELSNFLTAGNAEITKDDIAVHIVGRYPELLGYMNLRGPLTVAEYRQIEKELNASKFFLYAMSQDLSFLENKKEDEYHLKLEKHSKKF